MRTQGKIEASVRAFCPPGVTADDVHAHAWESLHAWRKGLNNSKVYGLSTLECGGFPRPFPLSSNEGDLNVFQCRADYSNFPSFSGDVKAVHAR